MPHVCMSLQKPEECVLFLGAGVTGGCEPPDVVGRNGANVLWRSSKSF